MFGYFGADGTLDLMGAMAPLLAKLQFNNAKLAVFDEKVVPKGDQSQLGSILESNLSARARGQAIRGGRPSRLWLALAAVGVVVRLRV